MSHFGLTPDTLKEPEVFINGVKLNFSQSMTLRVAISGFRSDMLEPNALGGSDIAPLYAARAREIEQFMFLNLNGNIPPASVLSSLLERVRVLEEDAEKPKWLTPLWI